MVVSSSGGMKSLRAAGGGGGGRVVVEEEQEEQREDVKWKKKATTWAQRGWFFGVFLHKGERVVEGQHKALQPFKISIFSREGEEEED